MVFAIILVVVVCIIGFMLLTGNSQTQQPTPSAIPSVIPNNNNAEKPGSVFDSKAQDRLLEKVQNREALSQSDELAKNKILSLLPSGKKSGVVYQSSNIIIEYVSSANVFQVEILTKDFEKAKKEGASWLKSQGLSQEGICNYPVEFYLNYEVLNALRGSTIQFNPLTEGC